MNDTSDQYYDGEEYWETPSLAWIHRVRRRQQEELSDRRRKPLGLEEIEKIAQKYGLNVLPELRIEEK
jgi:hypothetical protein